MFQFLINVLNQKYKTIVNIDWWKYKLFVVIAPIVYCSQKSKCWRQRKRRWNRNLGAYFVKCRLRSLCCTHAEEQPHVLLTIVHTMAGYLMEKRRMVNNLLCSTKIIPTVFIGGTQPQSYRFSKWSNEWLQDDDICGMQTLEMIRVYWLSHENNYMES